jgi:type I restriction enzyme M protein
MANVGAVISNIRNIMRQDRGISGDAQRLEQLGWMLFLKIMDDKDQELEVIKDNYVSVIPEKFQWRNWATNPEGITGEELINFIDSNELTNKGLFLTLRELKNTTNPKRAMIVQEVFDGTNNYMKSGYEMRKVINKLNEIDFTKSEDKHVFGSIYESILQELRDAGNKGEYYTPRAVTQLMTMMTDPKLGEKVLDPAAGTGGFLSAAIDHVRDTYVKTVDDEAILQKSITGWELKPVAYVLGLTNLILHEIDVPDYHYIDSLKKEYNSIGKRDQVDVILANPPFGASIGEGVETNFPSTYRCRESADLFIVLMLQLLKPNGRCAIVLPDGSITGEGVKARIREKLLTDCNLHTIIRLPQTTFFPATVSTNLLFFEKGSPTKDIWYYEHTLPEGQKSYSKTKPIQFKEFNNLINWWNNRIESEHSWKVNVNDLKGWSLDVKNPNIIEENLGDPVLHYTSFKASDDKFKQTLDDLISELHIPQDSLFNEVLNTFPNLFKKSEAVKLLRQSILEEAIRGNFTEKWRSLNPNKYSSSALLKSILDEKQELVKDKKIKREKLLSPISEDEIPFNLPNGWVWCRFVDIAEIARGGSPRPIGEFITTEANGINWIKIGDTKGDTKYIESTREKIKPEGLKSSRLVEPGDFLLTNSMSFGRPYIMKTTGCIHDGWLLIRYNKKFIDQDYLYSMLSSTYIYNSFKETAQGGVVQNLNIDKARATIIPIPPLDEQKAIFQKIEILMERCRTLELEITQSEDMSQSLLQSLFVNLFQS